MEDQKHFPEDSHAPVSAGTATGKPQHTTRIEAQKPSPRSSKKWTEYLLDFFMLFLAVFLGFLTENYRETQSNNQKEIHYIKGMMQDLKKDTAAVSFMLSVQNIILDKMDGALSIPVSRLHDINSQDSFFHNFFYIYSWVALFHQNNNTYTQLKNAGGFSVIHRQETIDMITALNSFYEDNVKDNEKYYVDYYNKIVQLGTQIMDMPMIAPSPNDDVYTVIPNHVEVFNRYDMPLLRELYSVIRYEKGVLTFYMLQEKSYMEQAEAMIRYLNKEYHLENE